MSGVAIVTGSGSGIGAFIARELGRRGLHVAVADLDLDAARGIVDEIAAAGGRAIAVRADAADPDSIEAMFDSAAGLGPVAVLVNNAGGQLPGPQFPDGDSWRRALDLNLVMPMLATRLAVERMPHGGAVVNVSSSGGWDRGAYRSPEYGAAKAGLVRFTTAVQDLDHRFGVRVSCVIPHWIGLPRAVEEYEALSAPERAASGGLIDPGSLARTVADLAEDPTAAGRVLVVRAGREPYAVDPADMDPLARIAP